MIAREMMTTVRLSGKTRSSPKLIGAMSNLRRRALRKGVWFHTLTLQERVLSCLIIKHIKIVKNVMLATVIARIIGKLIYAIKNSFMDMIERRGREITESWARAAYAMGWKEASKWIDDTSILTWYGLTAYFSNGRGFGNGGC